MTPSQLSEVLNRQSESICKFLLPNGRRSGHHWVAGDVGGSAGQSLKIVLEGDKVGVWSDFHTGEVGGDLIDLWRVVMGVSLFEAMQQSANYAGVKQVDGYENRPQRAYKRPERPRNARKLNPEGKVYAYLKSRGLSDATLEDFQIGEQDDKTILFPYKKGGQLYNTKYLSLERVDGKKKCWQEENPEPILFGWQALDTRYPNTRVVVLTEGECFPGETEILTDEGWIRLDRYQDGRVAQWDHGVISFVYPLARIEKEYSGDLVRYEQRGYLSITTPNHNMIAISKSGEYYKHKAIDGSSSVTDKIPRCGVCDGEGIELTYEQIALCVAVSADAAIDVRKLSYAGGPPRKLPVESRYARFGFKKQRKVDRLRLILNECGIIASDTEIAKGYRSICFGLPDWVPGRILPNEWIAQATLEQREFILDELIHWDGNSVPNRTMTEYSSKYKENVDFVQALCFTSGRCSSIISRKNSFGEWYKASILNGKTTSSWQQLKEKRKLIHHDGMVYCVQVPSGAILIRQENKVSVSGNCDAATYHQHGIPALSIPNGGGKGEHKQDWIESDYEQLSRFDTIFLSMDQDDAGKEAEKEIIRRLGADRCRVVALPYKDANECLMKGMVNFNKYLLQAKSLDPVELKPADYFTEDVVECFFPKPGTYRGMKTPWESVSEAIRFNRSELVVWSGFSGSGKSQMLGQVAIQGMLQGERFVICSLEMPAKKTLSRMAKQLLGDGTPTEAKVREAMAWLRDKCWIINVVGKMKTDRILDDFKYAAKRYDIHNFIIDSLTKCNIREDDYEAQKCFVDEICDFNHAYEATTHLVVHQRKPSGNSERPDKFGARGAAAITDEASSVLCVWRPSQEEDEDQSDSRFNTKKKTTKKDHNGFKVDSVLYVDKNRDSGVEGKFNLFFDPNSLQFQENYGFVPVNYMSIKTMPNGEVDDGTF